MNFVPFMSAGVLAYSVVVKARDNKISDLTPMKLNKLAFLCQAWNLAFNDRVIFTDDIEAWKYGPVVPSIYQDYKYFGDKAIGISDNINSKNVYNLIPESVLSTLNYVMDNYGKGYSGPNLSTITHKKGSPWDKTYHNGLKNKIIKPELIKEYYKQLKNENRFY